MGNAAVEGPEEEVQKIDKAAERFLTSNWSGPFERGITLPVLG